MDRKFYKMHGTGNDYILFDCIENEMENPSAVAKRLSDRHFGIGGDGVILLCKSSFADCGMKMFNADGSEGKMCGNGIRLIGKLFFDLGYAKGKLVTVETASGVKTLELFPDKENRVSSVKVDMGRPCFESERIPVLTAEKSVVGKTVKTENGEWKMTCVSMGNPHCVIFSDNCSGVEEIGPRLEKSRLFPDGVNTEIVRVENAEGLTMRVWERGSGETLSCGTGACAAVAAAVQNGYCKKDTDIAVAVKGGVLSVRYSDTLTLTGGAELVYEGRVRI